MPTYDYICKACSHEWEEFQSIKAKPSRKCPECGKLKAERQIGTGAGIIFKGSGFYITDYRSDSYKAAASGDAPKTESKSSDSSKSSSSDSSSSSSSKSAE
ncbi:MAG: zinc ribbon domain-containing protein [Planctomycetaceae bacterium]|nr:zinc ribbon domain-containing protein [Planctomycetaceae bacterium]